MKTCLTWKSITEPGGGDSTNPPFSHCFLLLSLLPRSGTQIEEKQRKKRNESQGEIGERRELRTQKGKLENNYLSRTKQQGNPIACIFVIIYYFPTCRQGFSFWSSYPPDTRGKTQSPSNAVASCYSVHTRSTMLSGSQLTARWRERGMEGWSPHYPLIAVPRSATCLSLP